MTAADCRVERARGRRRGHRPSRAARVAWVSFAFALALLLTTVPTDAASPVPTFTHDVAPLLLEHCAECHQPGGSAPFALVSYEDVRPRARQIVAAVTSRQMPPWKPTGPRGQFHGDRRLADADIGVLREWLAGGAPRGEGDSPRFEPASSEWQLGTPDAVVRLDAPYRLPAGGLDRLRNFVIRLPVQETRYVRAWEFRTTNARVVHHATMMVDRGGAARTLDAADPESGYEGLIPFSAQSPDGYFLGWTPGQRASESPADLAWRIDPGDDLIVMLHMRPDEQAEEVDARLALYFSDTRPSHAPVMIRLNRQDLDIPAGAASYTASDTYTLPVAVDLHAVQPHAHYLARTIEVSARTPDGHSESLLRIPDWDFHWQDVYRYRRPVSLPAGTRLTMTMVFDNSTGNRANPGSPPVRVIWGQRSNDEMADVWLQVVAASDADRPRLVADLRRTLIPQHIAGYRKMLEVDPGNAALHDDLALLGVESGNLDLAVTEFGETARLRPRDARAHYNLGNALLSARRADEAVEPFRTAIRLDPDYGLGHQGLGIALSAVGRAADAAAELEVAVQKLPQAPEAHYNHGVVLQQLGRFDAALRAYETAARLDAGQADARYAAALIREARGECATAVRLLRQAVAIRPAWSMATLELAWVLAVAPDASVRNPAEALRLAVAATDGSAQRDARALDVLAAALAANGRYDEAASRAREALAATPATDDAARRNAMATRLQLYQRHQPFVLEWQPPR